MKQHQQRPLAVGDLCTTKSKFPENAGLRVVVTAHVPGRRFRGKLVQYSIQRIDGSPHPLITAADGSTHRNTCKIATIGRSRLVRLDLDGEDHRDKLVEAPARCPVGTQNKQAVACRERDSGTI